MSNDLFNPKWEKSRTPRTYYLAIASNGKKAIRGSWRDVYSYASVCINRHDDLQFLYWASFHSTKELADKNTKSGNKRYGASGYIFETIELQKIDRKEFAKLSRMRLKEINQERESYYQKMQEYYLKEQEQEQQLETQH